MLVCFNGYSLISHFEGSFEIEQVICKMRVVKISELALKHMSRACDWKFFLWHSLVASQ